MLSFLAFSANSLLIALTESMKQSSRWSSSYASCLDRIFSFSCHCTLFEDSLELKKLNQFTYFFYFPRSSITIGWIDNTQMILFLLETFVGRFYCTLFCILENRSRFLFENTKMQHIHFKNPTCIRRCYTFLLLSREL